MDYDTIYTLSTEKLKKKSNNIYKKSKISLPGTKILFSLIVCCYTNSRAKYNFK